MPLQIAHVQAEPVRLDSLADGSAFELWWPNEEGRRPDVSGTVRYLAGEGYVSVRLTSPQAETTEWSCATQVVPKEDAMPRVQKSEATKAPVAAPKAAPAPVAAPKAEKKAASNPCLCGCGKVVARNFAPGHDSRVYSRLAKIAAGKEKLKDLTPEAQAWVKAKGGVQAALDAHKRPPTAANAPKAKKADAVAAPAPTPDEDED